MLDEIGEYDGLCNLGKWRAGHHGHMPQAPVGLVLAQTLLHEDGLGVVDVDARLQHPLEMADALGHFL